MTARLHVGIGVCGARGGGVKSMTFYTTRLPRGAKSMKKV